MPLEVKAGAITASDPAFEPGSFTILTDHYRIVLTPIQFTGTQACTVQGTGVLRVIN
jgi:hypothetical protein